MKSERTTVKKTLKAIDASFLVTARQILDVVSEADAPAEVIGVLRSRIEKLVADHFAHIERNTLDWYDNLINKYGITLRQLELERDKAATRLDKYLKELGYE